MTDTTDNTKVPVLQGKLSNGMDIPAKTCTSPGTAGRLAKQPTMSKANMEAVKRANREIALSRIDIERFVEKQVSLAYSDDADETTTAQERVAARKWLESMAFSSDSNVKSDHGRVEIHISGIGSENIKDIVSTQGDDG